MIAVLSHYLDIIRHNLRVDLSIEREIMNELEAHIEDELEELTQAGLSEEEAASNCVRLLGEAKVVAHQIYEAYSQGSWWQVFLASMPHMLFGLVFALNWWHGIGWLLVILGLVLVMAIYGWWHGKPTWLFSWMGYSLLPVVAAGIFLLYLPKGWSWLAVLLYIPLALWLVVSVTVQTIKKDWLYSSGMLLPVPIILGWSIVIGWQWQFPELNLELLYNYAPWIGLSFLALGVSVAMFIRLRQRWLKISVLFVSGLLTLTLVAFNADGRLGMLAFVLLTLIMLGFFLTPALLERKIRRSD